MTGEKQSPATHNSDGSEHDESAGSVSTDVSTDKTGKNQKGVEEKHQQELLDEGIEESFPASDPPSVSHVD